MYYQLFCHRPRTQRIGVNSYPRDIFLAESDSLEELKEMKIEMTNQHETQIANGYPWDGGLFNMPNGQHFQMQPNDEFKIKESMTKTNQKYIPPKEDTAEELVGIALNNLKKNIFPI